MNFNLNKSKEILSRTPKVLQVLLTDLSIEWTNNNEGEHTWSPYQVIGHLIHGEKTDWITRAKIILSDNRNKTFEPFDRFAQEKEDLSLSIEALLNEFELLRMDNLKELDALKVNDLRLIEKGIHPELGEVNLQQLLSCWTVHDLGHISQITRVMAKQYRSEVGPWVQYLGILK